MPIKLKCKCGQVLTVSDASAGKTGKCPKCQAAIRIPADTGTGASSTSTSSAPTSSPTQKPTAGKPAAPKPGQASKPAAGKPAPVKAAAARPVASGPAQMDALFDEIGLKKKTGPTCPKCRGAISPNAALCTHCGFHLETGEQAIGYELASEKEEFNNPFLQEAANNMQSEIVSDERHAKAGTPWWMLASFLLGALCIAAAGVIIVDATMNEPEPVGTLMGNLQRQKFGVVAGVTFAAVGTLISFFAHLSIVVFAFYQSIGKGFAALLVPLFAFVYGCMTWADNKSGIIGLIVGAVLAGAGTALTISNGGIRW